MNRARKHQPAATLRSTEPTHFQAKMLRETIIETRLQALTMFVESLGHATYSALFSERAATHEAVEELCVKEAALRWILRVAKHSEGLVRNRLWMDLEKAVSSLEWLAESIRNSEKVIPFANSGVLRREAVETSYTWGNVT